MNDLIDRQKCIEDILAWCVNLNDPKMLVKDDVVGVIKMMPSAEPKRGMWIPMTEKLPEDGEHILISCTNGYVATITYSEVGERRHIAAWMSLPEPYEEDTDD